jgi:hypothetical protein
LGSVSRERKRERKREGKKTKAGPVKFSTIGVEI